MRKLFSLVVFLVLLAELQGCKLFSDDEEQLPPMTQEGRNTFGCLVNGRIWLPEGYDGTANLDASYDPTFLNGSLDISAYRITNEANQFLAFGGTDISKTGEYTLSNVNSSPGAIFNDSKTDCDYNEPMNIVNGKFVITKLDLVKGIVSGTFEFTLRKTNCIDVSVTEGRFDMRIQ